MGTQNTANGAVMIAIKSPTRIVLVREMNRPDAYWKFPGGSIEDGETVIGTAIREGGEETHVELRINQVRHVAKDKKDGGRYTPNFCVADVTEEQIDTFSPKTEENGEPMQAKLFGLDDLIHIPDFLPPHRKFFPHVIDALA